jgi:hypothetical protein
MPTAAITAPPMPARLHALARDIDKIANVARVDAERACAMLAEAVAGFLPPAALPPAAQPAHAALLDEVGALWVRPRRAAQICGIGLTRLYELLSSGEVESRRLKGARLVSVASLMALGQPEALRSPTGLAAARRQQG